MHLKLKSGRRRLAATLALLPVGPLAPRPLRLSGTAEPAEKYICTMIEIRGFVQVWKERHLTCLTKLEVLAIVTLLHSRLPQDVMDFTSRRMRLR